MRLLVATDFSPSASQVLTTAANIAKGLSAEVRILHVAPPEEGLLAHTELGQQRTGEPADPTSNEKQLVDEAVDSLRLAGVQAEGDITAGPCADVIVAEAADMQADMIVIGSHGFGAALRLLLGSVSSAVLKKARCPVVVVPAYRK